MSTQASFLSRILRLNKGGLSESINDLREKEFNGGRLTFDEKQALANFDAYRLQVLNSEQDEEIFHQKYRQIQVIANLGDWKDFLKPEFSQPRH